MPPVGSVISIDIISKAIISKVIISIVIVSHCDIILLLIWIQFLRSTFVFMHHFGAKCNSSQSHFEDDSSPHISGSGSLIRIDLMFVLFKHVILMWINYLETWLRSDNTSCYYTSVILYIVDQEAKVSTVTVSIASIFAQGNTVNFDNTKEVNHWIDPPTK